MELSMVISVIIRHKKMALEHVIDKFVKVENGWWKDLLKTKEYTHKNVLQLSIANRIILKQIFFFWS